MPAFKSFKALNDFRKGEHFKSTTPAQRQVSSDQLKIVYKSHQVKQPLELPLGCDYCGHYHTPLQCLNPKNSTSRSALPFYRDSLWEVMDSNEIASEWREAKTIYTLKELTKNED